jgi:hypothetical protein
MNLKVLALSLLLGFGTIPQQKSPSFTINPASPYVYMVLDHVGPRKPAFDSEPSTGVWIKLVNNCRLPILVQTINTDEGVNGITVLDHIEKYGEGGVTIEATYDQIEVDDGRPKTSAPASVVRKEPKLPYGYDALAGDVTQFTKILPGENLVFSVPIDHVIGSDYYMRVRFAFDIPGSQHGPYSYVDSFTVHVPGEYLNRDGTLKK